MSGVSHWFCASHVRQRGEIGVDWLFIADSFHWQHIWLPKVVAWRDSSLCYAVTVRVPGVVIFLFGAYVRVWAAALFFLFLLKCSSQVFGFRDGVKMSHSHSDRLPQRVCKSLQQGFNFSHFLFIISTLFLCEDFVPSTDEECASMLKSTLAWCV